MPMTHQPQGVTRKPPGSERPARAAPYRCQRQVRRHHGKAWRGQEKWLGPAGHERRPGLGRQRPVRVRSNAAIVLTPGVLSFTYTCPTTGDACAEANAVAGAAPAATPPRLRRSGLREALPGPPSSAACWAFGIAPAA
jgi:hypothetical protein